MDMTSLVNNIATAVSRRVVGSLSVDLARLAGAPVHRGLSQYMLAGAQRLFSGQPSTFAGQQEQLRNGLSQQRTAAAARVSKAQASYDRRRLQYEDAHNEHAEELANPTGKDIYRLESEQMKYLSLLESASDALKTEVSMRDRLSSSITDSLARNRIESRAPSQTEENLIQISERRRNKAAARHDLASGKLSYAEEYQRAEEARAEEADNRRREAFRAHRAVMKDPNSSATDRAQSRARKDNARDEYQDAMRSASAAGDVTQQFIDAQEKAAKALNVETSLHDQLIESIKKRIKLHGSRDKTRKANSGMRQTIARTSRIFKRISSRVRKSVRGAKGVKGKAMAAASALRMSGPAIRTAVAAIGSTALGGALSFLTGPVGIAVGVLGAVAVAGRAFVARQRGATREMIEGQIRPHGELSGTVAGSLARYDIGQFKLSRERALGTANTASAVTEAGLRLDQESNEKSIRWENIANSIQAATTDTATFVLRCLNAIDVITPLVEQLTGLLQMLPWVESIDQKTPKINGDAAIALASAAQFNHDLVNRRTKQLPPIR